MKKRPKRPFRTIFLMEIHEKEAKTAISYNFSYENSWKTQKIELIKTGLRFKPVLNKTGPRISNRFKSIIIKTGLTRF